jgi:glycosyltransferase involved in cell wall biosynthesis
MKVAINQVRGNSGVDIWAQNLCGGLQRAGVSCNLDLLPAIYQFHPYFIRFRKTIDNDTDIIQSNTWNGFGFRNNVPLVVTEHGVFHDPLLNPYKTLGQKLYHRYIFRFEQKSLAVADAVVCVSENTRTRLIKAFDYTDAQVIYNGIDSSVFKPQEPGKSPWIIPENRIVLLFVGNLTRMKGADLLPGIMDILGDRYLLLVTSGFKQNVNVHHKNILNIGSLHQKSLIDAYNLCDIFLAPTRLEGFGLSVAEAMACGKPVVATNGSSLPELVVDGKGGFLCRMDDEQDFADKIRHLAGEENLRREMGAFNRKRVEEKFTLEGMKREYLHLYRSLIR